MVAMVDIPLNQTKPNQTSLTHTHTHTHTHTYIYIYIYMYIWCKVDVERFGVSYHHQDLDIRIVHIAIDTCK